MVTIEWLITPQVGVGVLIAVGVWIVGKIVDLALERLIDRKLIAPAFNSVRWRIRAFLTRMNPIRASFEIGFTPSNSVATTEAKEIVAEGFEKCEEYTKSRFQISHVTWDESGSGFAEALHADLKFPFQISLHIEPDVDDVLENPEVDFENRNIEKIHFEIKFQFPYHELSNTLTNLGTFASYLERGLGDVADGTFSDGQFIIRPIEGELTMDEWIEEEGFQVTLLLAGDEPGQTEVEFFPDHAEIHPPYSEMDSEVIRYAELMIQHYYLRKG